MADVHELPVDDGRSGTDAEDLALELVGYNKDVLGIGSASASLTERLAGQECTLFAVDIDEGVWGESKEDAFDVVLLTGALAGSPDPLRVLSAAARKLKPSGMLVAWLPNTTHGDTRAAILEGRFRYGESGALDGLELGHFTLGTIRDLFRRAGLVIVNTSRVIVPLVEPQFGVTRDQARPEVLNDLMDDPEIETYEFVVRAVRDNGDKALGDLARRVDELADRARAETTRTAVLRSQIWQMDLTLDQHRKDEDVQKRAIAEQQRYIEALRGHVSGLEQNVESLTHALEELHRAYVASEANYRGILGRRTVQATAPIRLIYDKLTRQSKKS